MPKQSSGILLFRKSGNDMEVFLVHPGGPFWVKKDTHAWSIPKGELGEGEDALKAAIREFEEETGSSPKGHFIPLTPILQKGGKKVHCFAVKGDFEPSDLKSNTFTMEWPPKSGRMADFPEIDKGEWFTIETAMLKINESQVGLIKELVRKFI